MGKLAALVDEKTAAVVNEVYEWIKDGARSNLTGEPDLTDPLQFRPLDPRAELTFLKRAEDFLDRDLYMGPWPKVLNEFEGDPVLFLNTFSLPRPDKPNKPRLIVDGGTKMHKTGHSFNDRIPDSSRYTRMGAFVRLL